MQAFDFAILVEDLRRLLPHHHPESAVLRRKWAGATTESRRRDFRCTGLCDAGGVEFCVMIEPHNGASYEDQLRAARHAE